jgi:hypothetical protein
MSDYAAKKQLERAQIKWTPPDRIASSATPGGQNSWSRTLAPERSTQIHEATCVASMSCRPMMTRLALWSESLRFGAEGG